MAQFSLHPWKNDIAQSTSNLQLNGKRYAKHLVCLEGQAIKNMIMKDPILYNLSLQDSDGVSLSNHHMPLPTVVTLPYDNSSSVSTSSTTTTVVTNNTSTPQVLILRCIDKALSSLPSQVTFSKDFIQATMGFHCIDMIKRNLSVLYQDTINVDSLPQDAVLDPGDFATMRKTPRNTTLVPWPSSFGDVIHFDIIIGPEVALANVHYGLLFTDRFSRMTYILPLQNQNSDIIKQLDHFFAQLGFVPC